MICSPPLAVSDDADYGWVDYIINSIDCIPISHNVRRLQTNTDREDEIMGYRLLKHLEFLQKFGPGWDDNDHDAEAGEKLIARILPHLKGSYRTSVGLHVQLITALQMRGHRCGREGPKSVQPAEVMNPKMKVLFVK